MVSSSASISGGALLISLENNSFCLARFDLGDIASLKLEREMVAVQISAVFIVQELNCKVLWRI